ncbi:DUF192 domain-containing protein [Candidatus Peregrinibacteria bacterium]|nr:DUF192 domain-containing protein [Candidatus Peregrinibacteria bacterium]
MKRLFIISILAVFLLSGCKFSFGNMFFDVMLKVRGGKFSTKKITLETDKEQIQLTAEVADSERERERGYMEREKVEEGKGMLFIFEDEAPRNFWMKNTLIPLDILYLNNQKEVVTIVENMEPCKVSQCPSYSSRQPAMYALELPAGFVKAHGVMVGDKISEE